MRGRFSNIVIAFTFTATMVLAVGCTRATSNPLDSKQASASPSASQTSGIKTKPKVGFGLYYRNDQWWKDLEAASNAKAQELGIDLLVQDGSADANKQVGQIEAFVTQGVDAIMFAPIDGNASTAAVAEAKKKGIAVVTLESTLDDPSNVSTQLIFDQNQAGYDVGKEAADFMNRVHGGKGKYVVITDPSNNVVLPKGDAFAKAMRELCPTAERLTDVNAKCAREPAATAIENLLAAHKDLYVMFGANTDMGLGIVATLDSKALPSDEYFVGMEGWWSREYYDALVNKKYVKAMCITPGVPLGTTALQLISDNLNKGTAYPPVLEVQAVIVTQANAAQYDQEFKNAAEE